jgi:maltose O-acetyltransferase
MIRVPLRGQRKPLRVAVSNRKAKDVGGELYNPNDTELEADRDAASAWMVRYSAAVAASDADRHALSRELLAEVGDSTVIRPPFHCDHG